MRGLAFWFFLSAMIYLLAGMVFGIQMSATHDHAMSPVHAHLNLIGGVAMAIMGLYYHGVPAAAATRLATIHFIVATLGLWLIIPGIALALTQVTEGLAIAGSFVTVLAMLLFLIVVFRNRTPAMA